MSESDGTTGHGGGLFDAYLLGGDNKTDATVEHQGTRQADLPALTNDAHLVTSM